MEEKLVKVSDYIANFLVKNGIKDVFTVVGGGAMHMNDSFGHHLKLHCTYNHNEQASAIAAEAYARIDNKIAAVCVTTGPGATNAITGVVGGWMDSIPMLIFSGQARYATTIHASGLNLRTRGIQEFDIIGSVKNMTKYCELVTDAKKIRYCLEKALYMAHEGRPGPCWLDIPLDIQATMINPDELDGFIFPENNEYDIEDKYIDIIIDKIKNAQRPVIIAGNGIRLGNAHKDFTELVKKLNVPVVSTLSSVDAVECDNYLFVGKTGMTGDRAGNFAVQNSDVLLSLGSRLSFSQTGFNYQSWARGAFKIINDIDSEELEKDSIKPDIKIAGDVKILINKFLQKLESPLKPKEDWLKQCREWKEKYPVVLPEYYKNQKPHLYVFFKELTKNLTNTNLVIGVGSSRVVGSQSSEIRDGVRFIVNPSTAAMGYDLPASIGVAIADKNKKTIMVTGDGSIQMNIQELQTIVQNKLPISIFVINNNGYHTIKNTQNNFFKGHKIIGVGDESGDLSFPNLKKLVGAYGLKYKSCDKTKDLNKIIEWSIKQNSPNICEIFTCDYTVCPRTATKVYEDGTMVSSTLENMKPFLSDEEINSNMFIERFKVGGKYA